MKKDKLLIHLIDGKIIEIEETFIFLDNMLNNMNDNNKNIMKDKYIIPKSNINYIEVVRAGSENNNE